MRPSRSRHLCHHTVKLTHNTLVRVDTANHLLLREPDPEGRVDLLRLLGAVNLLRNAFDLAARHVGRLPYLAQLVERTDIEPDLLAEVLFVLDEVERPLAQVDNGRERNDAGEEVSVRVQGDGLRDHFANLAGRRDGVPRMRVESIAVRDDAMGCARIDAPGR
jgi:hypothetical protein